MKQKFSLFRLAVCLLLCLCLLTVLGFWIHECSHQCDGEECVVCQDILLQRQRLTAGDVQVLLASVLLPAVFAVMIGVSIRIDLRCGSPVYWKVKLTI